MSLFDMLRGRDINAGLEEYRNREKAVLIDVRTQEEYAAGHIPGSINIPVERIRQAQSKIKNPNTPVYTYCLSGARSGQAVSQLKRMGYKDVNNIGGINRYSGRMEP